jgi:hypothetical protein
MKTTLLMVATCVLVQPVAAAELRVTNIQVVHRNGQTFVVWKDVAEGDAGAGYRYSLYRSERPITEDNLAVLRPVIRQLLNNSGKHYGYHMFLERRIDTSFPTATIEPNKKPLPPWSGLAVRTVEKDGDRYYAVVAFDAEGRRVAKIVPGQSATKRPVVEKVAPIQPLKTGDSTLRGRYAKVVQVTGRKNLPLMVTLHASSARGGPGADHGDYYQFWGRPEWGYRDGLPWQFTVDERRVYNSDGRYLSLRSRETLAAPGGNGTKETYWFGYYCVPQWAAHQEPRAYNFTERRMQWLIDWVKNKYHVDPERVYAEGGSMGAWGTATYALRHPALFAAIYPNRPRTIQRGLPTLVKIPLGSHVVMSDGKTDFYERMNMVRFVADHHEDLPFLGWCCGRHDGFASFNEQIEMVKALTAGHHGFAFAWNNGTHSTGAVPMREIKRWYPPEQFARNQSYPAFGNSSIDGVLGTGEVDVSDGQRTRRVLKDDNGALEGGINLGFVWKDIVDKNGTWSVTLRNELAKKEMTVDVTPRRCQQFKPRHGETMTWINTFGGSGTVTADKWGLVTVTRVKIKPDEETILTLKKR